MRGEKTPKAFAYRIYSHFTQQCNLKANLPKHYQFYLPMAVQSSFLQVCIVLGMYNFEEDEKVTEIKFHFAKCKRRSMRKRVWHFYYACSYSNKVCHKEHLLCKLTYVGMYFCICQSAEKPVQTKSYSVIITKSLVIHSIVGRQLPSQTQKGFICTSPSLFSLTSSILESKV